MISGPNLYIIVFSLRLVIQLFVMPLIFSLVCLFLSCFSLFVLLHYFIHERVFAKTVQKSLTPSSSGTVVRQVQQFSWLICFSLFIKNKKPGITQSWLQLIRLFTLFSHFSPCYGLWVSCLLLMHCFHGWQSRPWF